MKATFQGIDTTRKFATFVTGAFRKINLPLSEIRSLSDSQIESYLFDACKGFNDLPITINRNARGTHETVLNGHVLSN